jgi:AbrB family looped-hinge helix DNA binding protein
MAKVTSKLQVTIPKALAESFSIRPGDDIEWIPAGDSIRVVPAKRATGGREKAFRLRLFDQATRRQQQRQAALGRVERPADRGWTRDELYVRGRPR